ncbi:hypothetical protein [Treponema sp. C6A8]|uniref:hypothetical protein n=1 Tax=Treponema sp. C6A8 TaxID=1410609 RepID=UPI00048801C9|nr:hypothetical protein [Treponema sp. C6A8]
MFKFVNAKTVKPYKNYCSDILNQLKNILQNKYGIDCDFYLIGSGAKNLVTQNEQESYDLDYNCVIYSIPGNNSLNSTESLKWLKDTIRIELNTLLGDSFFRDAQDSKSVLTARLFFKNDPNKIEFSFDVAILAKNKNGNYCRLIHEKAFNISRFYWNEVPSSHYVCEKAEALKNEGYWQNVREKYIQLKNMYLERNDYDHPSFIVYVEAINHCYQKYIQN